MDDITSTRDSWDGSTRTNSVLKDLLSYYNLEFDEEEDDNISTFSFKQLDIPNDETSSLRSSIDHDYNRYVDEFEALVNKRNELQSDGGSFLTTFESKQHDFNFSEDIDEVRRMLDEDDFVESYLTTVKELKESVNNAVEEKVQIVPKVINKPIADNAYQSNTSLIYNPVNSTSNSDKQEIDNSEILKKKFEEEERQRENNRKIEELQFRENQRKSLEEKRKREQEERQEKEKIKKELEDQEILFKKQQAEIERQIEAAQKKKEEELKKEIEQQELIQQLLIKKKEEQRIKEEQARKEMEALKTEKALQRKKKIENDKKLKEDEKKRKEEEERIRKEEELRRVEEETRRKQQEEEKLKLEMEQKKIAEERFKERDRLKSIKKQYISKSILELLENSRRSKCWGLFQDYEKWKATIKNYSKHPPLPSPALAKDNSSSSLLKLSSILDEDKLENNMPFEKDDSNVVLINVRGEEISAIKERVLDSFPNLRALFLDTNHLQSLSTLKNLNELECLSLNDNRLTSIQMNREIASKLKELYALGNNITSLGSLRNTCQLRGLNLCNNKIRDLNGLQNNRNLQYLRVDINQISDLRMLDGFSNLQYLDCGYNELETLQNCLRYNLLLEDLILYQNKITQLPTFHQVLLKSLYLNTNLIEKLPSQFLYSPLLQYLNLSNNKIEHISPLSNCIMLRNINLSFNNIQSIDELLHLKYCRNIEEVKINDNPICKGVLYRELLIGILPNLNNLDGEPVSMNSRFSVVSHLVHYSPRLVGHLVSFIINSLNNCVPSIEAKQLRENSYKFMRDAITLDKSQRSLQALPTTDWNTKTTYYYMCSKQVIERSQFNNYHQCLSAERFDEKSFKQVQQRFSKRLDNRISQYEQKSEQKSKHFEEHLNFNAKKHQNHFSLNIEYQEKVNKIRSVCLIQRWFRFWHTEKAKRSNQNRHEAAIKIQMVWRGYISRKKNLPWILKALHIRHVSATKIQSVWKGYRVRNILKKARQFEDDEIFDLENAVDDLEYMGVGTDLIDVKIPEKRKNRKFEVYYYDVNTKTSHGGDNSIKEHFFPTQSVIQQSKNQNWISNEDDEVNTSTINTSENEDESIRTSYSNNNLSKNSIDSHTLTNPSLVALKNNWNFKNDETAKVLFDKQERFRKLKAKKKLNEEKKDPMKRLEMFKKTSGSSAPLTKPKTNIKKNLLTHTTHINETDMDLRSISSRSTESGENLRLPKINNKRR